MSTTTFTLYSSSGSAFYFPLPEWERPANNITKNIDLYNLWKEGDTEIVDTGIEGQEMSLGGVLCSDVYGTSELLSDWLDDLKTEINAGEEFTISELGDCINGVYVVKSFKFSTIQGSNSCYNWEFTFERVSDI